jgi:hypothetical protein
MKVMIDKRDATFAVDCGSYQPFGNTLITGGTLGWIHEDFAI